MCTSSSNAARVLSVRERRGWSRKRTESTVGIDTLDAKAADAWLRLVVKDGHAPIMWSLQSTSTRPHSLSSSSLSSGMDDGSLSAMANVRAVA